VAIVSKERKTLSQSGACPRVDVFLLPSLAVVDRCVPVSDSWLELLGLSAGDFVAQAGGAFVLFGGYGVVQLFDKRRAQAVLLAKGLFELR